MGIMRDHNNLGEEKMFQVLIDKDKYASFVTFCASCIVGSQKYKGCLLSENSCAEWHTPDDEAMCWLILENGVKKWNKEFKLKKEKMNTGSRNYLGFQSIKLTKEEKGTLPASKYTEKRTNSESKKLSGWDHEGVTRFKDLKMEIIGFRYEHSVDSRGKVIPQIGHDGKMTFSKKYDEYAKEAMSIMKQKVEMDSPEMKKRSRDICSSEQAKKKLHDELFNDTALSKFSNIGNSIVVPV